MSAAIWFWIIYVVSLVFGGWLFWPTPDHRILGSWGILFVLIGILGWGVFGPPIR